MLDLWLAIAHHLLVFTLFGVLFAELALTRRGMDAGAVAQAARIDSLAGALAVLIVATGFWRAIFAAKGWAYYSHNLFFYLKVGTFTAVGLMSTYPTLAFIRWRRGGGAPAEAQLSPVRRWLWMELGLFLLVPAFAAAMARGYGELPYR